MGSMPSSERFGQMSQVPNFAGMTPISLTDRRVASSDLRWVNRLEVRDLLVDHAFVSDFK